MGYAEIVTPDGRVTRVEDGQISRYKVEWCDKCDTIKNAAGGYYQQGLAGEKLMWFCEVCK